MRLRPHRNFRPLFAGFFLLAVASCSTPLERCVGRYTSEYHSVTNLLDEVEGNLARGYAWEEREVTRERFTECRDIRYDREGNARVIYRPCWREYTETERYRVPIDPTAEERKRDGLIERQAKLRAGAQPYVAACKQAFPDEKS